MIRTRALVKRFGGVHAVQGIDLDVRPGDIYGFLGANGSGKTTTVRMLLGLVLPTSGEVELLGRPMPKSAASVLPRVGALIEGPAAYGHLSGAANLSLIDAAGRGSPHRGRRARISAVLEQVGLAEVGRRPVKAYSLGMRQRLGLAAALLRSPDLLILDEPTNGLDPQGIREIRELLLALHARGTTIFLSSHLLAEVEQLCTRVGVLDGGRLVLQDQLSRVQAPTGNTVVHTPDVEHARHVLAGYVERHDGERLVIRGADSAALNAALVGAGVRVRELMPERRSLEQVVLEVTDPHLHHGGSGATGPAQVGAATPPPASSSASSPGSSSPGSSSPGSSPLGSSSPGSSSPGSSPSSSALDVVETGSPRRDGTAA